MSSRRYTSISDSSESERAPLKKQSVPDNPSFEGIEYDSFAQYQPEDLEEDYLNRQIEDEDDGQTEEELFEAGLKKSLPSTELRKIHTLARAGTLHRIKVRTPLEDVNYDATDGNVPGPSSGQNTLEVEDVFLSDDLMVEPVDPENIRYMTTTLQHKRSVRQRVKGKNEERPLSGWENFKLERAMRYTKFKNNVKESFTQFTIWKGHMKEIEGLFGTGVLSYFTFLRWLLYINLIVSLLTLCFLFVPQMIYEQSARILPSSDFTGIDLLTGEGYFNHTELYYGTYTDKAINGRYNMRYAYLLVGGGYFLICIIVLVKSMASSYNQNFIISGGDNVAPFSSKVFCAWDYGICNKETARIKMKSFAQDMLETLGSKRGKFKTDCFSFCLVIFLRVLMNMITMALLFGSAFLIYYVSDMSVEESFESNHVEHGIKGLLPAITMSVINLIVPSGFRLIASIENYSNPKYELTINLLRTITLKLASLVVYVVTVIVRLSTINREVRQEKCWENFIGQAFYKLAVIDFIAVLLATFFEEFIRNIVAKKCCSKHLPGFDISKNVLNLIYCQGICWLGTFYCPLLPFINVLKLFITFYVKKVSVVRNCRPSTRPFKASKMLLWFLCLLSLMLMLALVVIGYIMMDDETLKPSTICGPFRGQERIYDIVSDIINETPTTIRKIVNSLSSLPVIAAILFFMGLLSYYFRMRKVSNEKKIQLLKQQLALAGQDKKFLIEKLRLIMRAEHVD
ncbi:transmembrane channel-like protein 5 isoform X4 [Clytia hemisphaerica]|uniref:TMC domain-containing protein n=1 Tax=Clytia hemisphaerica TaxID=252671 RepID=A0A7M5UZP5_9CNID